MYVAYLDDSGTHRESDIAVAGCYVSTESGWRAFTREWNEIANDEGFDDFHMARFVAPSSQGHEPWCNWDRIKKDRVFRRLARVINENKRIGIGVALPKSVYDQGVPERIRDHYGHEHYTFAVRMCLMQIHLWRHQSNNVLPVKYVFDWETPGTSKYREITRLMTTIHPNLQPLFGLDTGGFCFESRRVAKPLYAADILAWQMNSHIRKIYPRDESEEDLRELHPGWRLLRENQDLTLGFYTPSNIRAWLDRLLEFERDHGIIP
jgi:hypothetical protein